jgi:hypothetical protein
MGYPFPQTFTNLELLSPHAQASMEPISEKALVFDSFYHGILVLVTLEPNLDMVLVSTVAM